MLLGFDCVLGHQFSWLDFCVMQNFMQFSGLKILSNVKNKNFDGKILKQHLNFEIKIQNNHVQLEGSFKTVKCDCREY